MVAPIDSRQAPVQRLLPHAVAAVSEVVALAPAGPPDAAGHRMRRRLAWRPTHHLRLGEVAPARLQEEQGCLHQLQDARYADETLRPAEEVQLVLAAAERLGLAVGRTWQRRHILARNLRHYVEQLSDASSAACRAELAAVGHRDRHIWTAQSDGSGSPSGWK